MKEYTAIKVNSDGYIDRITSVMAVNKTDAINQVFEYLTANPNRRLIFNLWSSNGHLVVLTSQLSQ